MDVLAVAGPGAHAESSAACWSVFEELMLAYARCSVLAALPPTPAAPGTADPGGASLPADWPCILLIQVVDCCKSSCHGRPK
jgi:hypothetical protein